MCVKIVCVVFPQGLVLFCTFLYMIVTGELFALLIAIAAWAFVLIEFPKPHTFMWKCMIWFLVTVREWP